MSIEDSHIAGDFFQIGCYGCTPRGQTGLIMSIGLATIRGLALMVLLSIIITDSTLTEYRCHIIVGLKIMRDITEGCTLLVRSTE